MSEITVNTVKKLNMTELKSELSKKGKKEKLLKRLMRSNSRNTL